MPAAAEKSRKLLALSSELEYSVLAAIIAGIAPVSVAEEGELSKLGKAVLKAVRSMGEGGQTPPFNLGSISLRVAELYSLNRDEVRKYLANINKVSAVTDIGEIVQKVRDKQVLVELVNEAASQLQQGNVDVMLLGSILQRDPNIAGSGVESVSELIKDGLPEPPVGLQVRSLPFLSGKTGGIYGVWAVGGEPKSGKSTLAWQVALDVCRQGTPVLYYDMENGWSVMMDRTRQIFSGDLGKIRAATEKLYYRDSIRTLERDLALVAPPALIVVDSVQKLPVSANYRRDSLDKWVHRFEMLKKRGYHTILVSEVHRASYGEASVSAYKETGEIEYTADTGLQVIPNTSGDMVEVHVVAARHRPVRGFLEYMRRTREWLWREIGESPSEIRELD